MYSSLEYSLGRELFVVGSVLILIPLGFLDFLVVLKMLLIFWLYPLISIVYFLAIYVLLVIWKWNKPLRYEFRQQCSLCEETVGLMPYAVNEYRCPVHHKEGVNL